MLYNVVSVDTDRVVTINKRNYLPVRYLSGLNGCEYKCILDMGMGTWFTSNYPITRVEEFMNSHTFMANVCSRDVILLDARLERNETFVCSTRHPIVPVTERFLRKVIRSHTNISVNESVFKVSIEFSSLQPVKCELYDLTRENPEDVIGSSSCKEGIYPNWSERIEWYDEFICHGLLPSCKIDFYMAGGFLVRVKLQ